MPNAQKWSILETWMWCHNFINMCSKLIIFLPRLVMYDCHLIMSYFYKKKNYNISSHLFKNWFKTFFSHFFLFINEFFAGDMGGGVHHRMYHIPTFLLLIQIYAHVCIYVLFIMYNFPCYLYCVSWPWNWEMANEVNVYCISN